MNYIDYEMRRNKMPIGTSDFKELVDDNSYYIDKTLLIKDIIDDNSRILLFTRPRRFGKTLNLSMLKNFFGQSDSDNSYLFKDKIIWKQKSEYIDEMGKYPVIYLTFKDIKEASYDEMYLVFRNIIDSVIAEHENIIKNTEMGQKDRDYYERIFNNEATEIDYRFALQNLSATLKKYYGRGVMILIDEYDTPLNSAHTNGYEKEAVSFMRGLLSGAFKDNSNLKKGIITGINKLAKENIFSGLNNLAVYTVFDKKYSEYFGITEDELKEMLKWCGMEFNTDIKEWYDGYLFGGYEMYNPWSVINYISRQEIQPYWVNTASNDLISECIEHSNNVFKKNVGDLVSGKSANVNIEKETIYDRLNESENIWGLFINAGYITLADNKQNYRRYNIKIPNKEVLDEFDKIIADSTNISYSMYDDMFEYLINDKEDLFFKTYGDIVLKMFSYHDFRENAYHMFMLGMCVSLRRAYVIKSNLETGMGRSDIICYPKSKTYPPIIMEFKATGKDKNNIAEIDEDELDKMVKEAINQIKTRKYYADFVDENYPYCILLGIAHHKKQSKILMEKIKV